MPLNAKYRGRGIIICAGGEKYLSCAWVCIRRLQDLNCKLPIQIWFLGRTELSAKTQRLFQAINVQCIDAYEVRKIHPCRILNGYELKPYSIINSSFNEVLLLDADNVPAVNPEYLFRMPSYREHGAVFWPRPIKGPPPNVWKIFDVQYRAEPCFDTAQILVNKSKAWRALRLSVWYNEHSDYYYEYTEGERETFHLAFRKLNIPYFMITTPSKTIEGVIYQHDHRAGRVFQHRRGAKWKLYAQNKQIKDFEGDVKCLQHLDELKRRLARASKTAAGHKNNRMVIRCPIDGFTGYGLHAQEIIKDLNVLGFTPRVIPIRVNEQKNVFIRDDVRRHFADYSDTDWELLLHPPNIAPMDGKNTIFFTMWESTRLAPGQLENLKKARVIVVPCEWNASTFNAQGIDVPIELCHLGIDQTVFKLREGLPSNLCVFGAAGNSHISGRTRKGLDDVIRAFQIAFPKEQDVRLKVKTLPESEVIDFRDNRISVYKGYLSQIELAEWYASLSCFVSAARAEAWGLMQHQAMAVGRPVIACRFGGLREFFDSSVGYCVDYALAPSDERYSGLGIWAQPHLDSLAERMREVYDDLGRATQIGLLASKRAHEFTWKKSNERLASIILKHISK